MQPFSRPVHHLLSAVERAATWVAVREVRRAVPADLVATVLFGSKARREARADSDVDLLFVFADLAPNREPHASMVEAICARIGAAQRVPISPWSVALADLRAGRRTPMLVDALADAVPVWPAAMVVPRPDLTPADAVFCVRALLTRVAEGGEEVVAARVRGDGAGAWARVRDDIVRLCTAALLLHGETRPRRAEAVRRATPLLSPACGGSARTHALLRWTMETFELATRPTAAHGISLRAACAEVERLRRFVAARLATFDARRP